ncbi:MAG: DUF2202 domain-containing protein [Rhodospirillaceae bacterium]
MTTTEKTDELTILAMSEAIIDEYKARATYRKVIEKFGPIRPFINIVEAENRHVNALLRLFDRFGVEPPLDGWPERVSAPSSELQACQDALDGEMENMEMYDRLLKQVRHPTVKEVLQNLKAASRDNHLPAFQRCVRRLGR